MKVKSLIVFSLFTILFLVFFCHKVIESGADKFVTRDINTVSKHKVGLLLGTSKYLRNGRVNLYYQYRICGAVDLYNQHKIHVIIVSGDNGITGYDEPSLMKADLIKAGVPANKIYCDFAGFSTLDSVLRAKSIFSANKVLVISQDFHVRRAIFIGLRNKMLISGYCVKDVPLLYNSSGRYREYLARVKAMIDIYILNRSPYFLGPKIELNVF